MGPAAASFLDLAVGAALALLVGWSLLRPLGSQSGRRAALRPAGLGLALVFGITLLVGIGFPLARLGAPVTPGGIAGLAVILAGTLLVGGRRQRRQHRQHRQHRQASLWLEEGVPGDRGSGLAGLLVLAGLALFLVKLALAPLWTWDHFAVWGLKSRRMIVDGALDLGFLDLRIFHGSEAHYPLGLPFAWRLLALGALPGDLAFKVCHALFGLALVAVTRHGLLLASGSRRIANALAAWLAVSPVLWDTIGVGHADLPMGLWTVTALVLVLGALQTAETSGEAAHAANAANIAPAESERAATQLRLAGLAAGFLPWIKQEGLLLALALVAAAALLIWRSALPDRPRRLLDLGLPAAVTLAGSRLVANVARTHGVDFFAGRWWVRAAIRVPHAGGLLRLAALDLLAPDWLGIWIAFFLACTLCLLAAARRRPRNDTAAVLAGLVGALLSVYVAVYFVTVLPPAEHLQGSFFRILCPLTPVALLAIAALFRPPGERRSDAVWRAPAGAVSGSAEPVGSELSQPRVAQQRSWGPWQRRRRAGWASLRGYRGGPDRPLRHRRSG